VDTATLTVTRTNGATGTVTVDYATSDGTATAGADYTATSGTLTFLDGQKSQTIPVPILNDGTLEGGTESFRVTLSNPTGGATLGSRTSETVAILDPDMIVIPPSTTEGQSVSGVLATFKGSNPSVPIGDYAATISWGDNSPNSPGLLTVDANGG